MGNQVMAVAEQPQHIDIEPFLRYRHKEYFIVRLDLAQICDNLMDAVVFRVFEWLTERQRRLWHQRAEARRKRGLPVGKEPRRWWISLSYPQLHRLLGGFAKSLNTTIAHLKALLESHLLLRRADPKNPYGTPLYAIDQREAQRRLDLVVLHDLPEEFLDDDEEEGTQKDAPKSPDPLSESGTPPSSTPYQNLVPSLPESGTPPTNPWYGPLPDSGTHKESKKRSEEESKKKDSAALRRLSFPLLSSRIEFETLRTAEWSAEAILALASKVLAVPDRIAIEAGGNEKALAQYFADWQRPAEWLLQQASGVDPARAWQIIDVTIRYMTTPGSPSWWVRPLKDGGRKTKAVVTLKNVADRFDFERADMLEHQWYPSEITPYDGPPLVYQAGYGGVPQIDDPPEGPTTGALPVPPPALPLEIATPAAVEEIAVPQESPPASEPVPRGMSEEDAQALLSTIREEFPMLSLGIAPIAPGCFWVGIEEAEDRWLNVKSWDAWIKPWPQRIQQRIEAAVAYGEQRLAAESSANEAAMAASMESG